MSVSIIYVTKPPRSTPSQRRRRRGDGALACAGLPGPARSDAEAGAGRRLFLLLARVGSSTSWCSGGLVFWLAPRPRGGRGDIEIDADTLRAPRPHRRSDRDCAPHGRAATGPHACHRDGSSIARPFVSGWIRTTTWSTAPRPEGSSSRRISPACRGRRRKPSCAFFGRRAGSGRAPPASGSFMSMRRPTGVIGSPCSAIVRSRSSRLGNTAGARRCVPLPRGHGNRDDLVGQYGSAFVDAVLACRRTDGAADRIQFGWHLVKVLERTTVDRPSSDVRSLPLLYLVARKNRPHEFLARAASATASP